MLGSGIFVRDFGTRLEEIQFRTTAKIIAIVNVKIVLTIIM